ncbi:hypothetical protein GGI12_001034 [Dipsacomyces acuminosporus]|nr:hypothetical protein GGI12_001034 [Dipsacomyces acuminosporus]
MLNNQSLYSAQPSQPHQPIPQQQSAQMNLQRIQQQRAATSTAPGHVPPHRTTVNTRHEPLGLLHIDNRQFLEVRQGYTPIMVPTHMLATVRTVLAQHLPQYIRANNAQAESPPQSPRNTPSLYLSLNSPQSASAASAASAAAPPPPHPPSVPQVPPVSTEFPLSPLASLIQSSIPRPDAQHSLHKHSSSLTHNPLARPDPLPLAQLPTAAPTLSNTTPLSALDEFPLPSTTSILPFPPASATSSSFALNSSPNGSGLLDFDDLLPLKKPVAKMPTKTPKTSRAVKTAVKGTAKSTSAPSSSKSAKASARAPGKAGKNPSRGSKTPPARSDKPAKASRAQRPVNKPASSKSTPRHAALDDDDDYNDNNNDGEMDIDSNNNEVDGEMAGLYDDDNANGNDNANVNGNDNNNDEDENEDYDEDEATDDGSEGGYDDEHNSPLCKPANAFILYRRAKNLELRAQQPGISVEAASLVIGKSWREESPSVRQEFQEQAREAREKYFARKRRMEARERLRKSEREGQAANPTLARTLSKTKRLGSVSSSSSPSSFAAQLVVSATRELSALNAETINQIQSPSSATFARELPLAMPLARQSRSLTNPMNFELDSQSFLAPMAGALGSTSLTPALSGLDTGLNLNINHNALGSFSAESMLSANGMASELDHQVASSMEQLKAAMTQAFPSASIAAPLQQPGSSTNDAVLDSGIVPTALSAANTAASAVSSDWQLGQPLQQTDWEYISSLLQGNAP